MSNISQSMSVSSSRTDWRTPLLVLISGALVVNMTMGVRHGMGLFLVPMNIEWGVSRSDFAFAIALQNLCWGISSPILGGLADRYGSAKIIVFSLLLYALGLWGMSLADNAVLLALTAGVMMGCAQGGSTVGVITGLVGRAYPPAQRAQALALSGALGAVGQFYMMPILNILIDSSWYMALWVSALLMILVMPLSLVMTEPYVDRTAVVSHPWREALGEALRDPSFLLLTAGYFVCGFQVVFISVHLPSYLRDAGWSGSEGTMALAIIGITNIIGTYWWGMKGAKYSKPWLLSIVYWLRSVVVIIFLLVPLSRLSIGLFAFAIGGLWLATVPLTNGIVANRFGTAHLSMLAGVVFLSHQIGSFLGVWMGGVLFDTTGSYIWAWMLIIALGIVAGFLHIPISEQALARGGLKHA